VQGLIYAERNGADFDLLIYVCQEVQQHHYQRSEHQQEPLKHSRRKRLATAAAVSSRGQARKALLAPPLRPIAKCRRHIDHELATPLHPSSVTGATTLTKKTSTTNLGDLFTGYGRTELYRLPVAFVHISRPECRRSLHKISFRARSKMYYSETPRNSVLRCWRVPAMWPQSDQDLPPARYLVQAVPDHKASSASTSKYAPTKNQVPCREWCL
jgi:hypothetical protein